jgi:opacity protein-like surface antigen
MRRKVCLSLALVLCLTAVAQAVPTVTLGNYNLLPNTAGQQIVLNITGITPNATNATTSGSVNGMVLNVFIDEGGTPYGGTPGPILTGSDVDAGPSIWVAPASPQGHNAPAEFYDAQTAQVNFLLTSGFVNATGGILATLIVDTTGFGPGIHKITISGGAVEANFNNTEILGSDTPAQFVYQFFDGTGGQITIVPEPSSVVLGLFAVAGLGAVAIRKRRARRA